MDSGVKVSLGHSKVSLGKVKIVTLGQGPMQLSYLLCLTGIGRSANFFAILKGRVCSLSPMNQRNGSHRMLVLKIIKQKLGVNDCIDM